MTPAEEDALYAKFWLNLKESDPIRIVIRAAYAKGREDGIAHERERAARVAESSVIREQCAAAIRRGE